MRKSKPVNHLPSDDVLPMRLFKGARLCTIVVFLVAGLVLCGWQWNIDVFRRPLPDLTAMNPLTALCFLFCSCSFLLLMPVYRLHERSSSPLSSGGASSQSSVSSPSSIQRVDAPTNSPGSRIANSAGKILAVLIVLIALSRIAGAWPWFVFRPDHFLYAAKLTLSGAGRLSNEMAVQTAICFLLSGLCLLLLNPLSPRGWIPVQCFSLSTAAIGLFSLIGYLYRVPVFYGSFSYVPMAVYTAFCFCVLSVAFLLVQPDKDIMKELSGGLMGSVVARSLLPLVVILPILFGYLRLVAYWKGLISTEFGVTLLVTSIISCFAIIIWYNMRLLNERDGLQRVAEANLLESEERFRLLVGSVKDYAIFMLDPSGRVMSWNEGAEQIKGYKKDEILGRHLSVFYTPEEIELGEPSYNLSRAAEDGRFEHEGWRVRKDGSIFWANVVFTAVHDAGGKLIGFTKVTRDITEKRRAEQQTAYLARLIEDTSDAVFSTDSSLHIRTWNKAAETLFGYRFEEVKGQSAGKILRTQMQEEIIRSIRGEMTETGYWKGEVYYLNKDNGLLTLLLSTSVVRTAAGEPDGYVMVCRDFTERKKLEQRLRQFNEDLEEQVREKTAEMTGIFERITDAFIALDNDFRYTYLNKRAGELIHREPASLIGKCVWDVFPDAVGSNTWHSFNRAMSEQRFIKNTDYYQPLDLWQENHLYPSSDGLSVFIRDITGQKKTEKAITDYKYALDQSSIVSITDEKGVIKYVNDNFCRVSKYDAEELIGQDHRVIGSNYHPAAFIRKLWQTISKGRVWKGEFRNKAKDGSIYWVDMTIVPFLNERNEPYEYMALDSDITERKKAEDLLGQSYQEIRQLASHLQDVREEERAGIAREIHDELGQQLTGLKMDISWIGKRKILQEDSDIRQKLAGVMNLLDIAIKTVRRIATDLRPSILDDLGLIAAIEWQSQEFQKRSGIETVFNTTLTEFRHSPVIAIGLFRICQESLTNVARHAEATKISITLQEQEKEFISLKIEDNGKGFVYQTVGGKKTLGLLGMKERALMMGGEFNVVSRVGEGTVLFITVPLKTADMPAGI